MSKSNAASSAKPAGYAHAKGARAAARKVMGPEAQEGVEFELIDVQGGRFDWQAIEQAPRKKGRKSDKKAGIASPAAEAQQGLPLDEAPAPAPAPAPEPTEQHVVTTEVAVEATEEEPAAPSAQASAFGAAAFAALSVDNHTPKAVQRQPKPVAEKKVRVPAEIKNGVRKPSVGTVCRAVWDRLDAFVKDNDGVHPTSKDVKNIAEEMKWNNNNASIEFYAWRKFNGITGRQPKAAK